MKNIWIFNHYATEMYEDGGGRHYWFAKYLLKSGYKPIIFCANTTHNRDNTIQINSGKFSIKEVDGIIYVFVQTNNYSGNGISRILNMFYFYKNIFKVSKKILKFGKPDIILASSVHPLTLVAGIKISKKLKIPCICEIRDLWPLTLVELGKLKENSLFTKLLYKGEKWIYERADALIYTMEGGKQYIIDKKWDKKNGGSIDIDKVFHINNGVDLEVYNEYKEKYSFSDNILDSEELFKVVYAGSMGIANTLDDIVETANILDKLNKKIVFIMYGDGYEKNKLEEYCNRHKINNVIFRGQIEKKYIPYILSKCDLNIFTGKNTKLYMYGISLNKLFDYLASGKPIISNIECRYNILEKYKCGITVNNSDAQALSDAIATCSIDKIHYKEMSNNCFVAVKDFDFKTLTKKLEKIIEATINNYKMES